MGRSMSRRSSLSRSVPPVQIIRKHRKQCSPALVALTLILALLLVGVVVGVIIYAMQGETSKSNQGTTQNSNPTKGKEHITKPKVQTPVIRINKVSTGNGRRTPVQ